VLHVEPVLAIDAANRRVHQVPYVGGLGGVCDVLALGDLVVVGGLDAVDAVRATHRRVKGGAVVQVAQDELGVVSSRTRARTCQPPPSARSMKWATSAQLLGPFA
jgi:hypothetical protein